MFLFADFVKRSTHKAEVFLSCVGSAETLGGCAVGNIVKQTLPGGADNGDNVRTLFCGSLCLHDILIDVAGCNDNIEVRVGFVAEAVEIIIAFCNVCANAFRRGFRNGHDGGANLFNAVGSNGGKIKLAAVDALRNLLRIHAGFDHCAADIVGCAAREQTLVEKVIDNNIGQRNFKCVYTVDAEKAANGALHRYRRVKVDKVLGILRNAAGRFAGFINKISIEVKF